MKKIILITCILLILTLSFASAVEFKVKSEYKKGEAFIAELSGQFSKPPLKENIEFFRGHVRVAFDHEVSKIGDNYYIFAPLIGKFPGNYSIVIDDIEYKQEGQFTDSPLIKNFTISEELADFSIDKGFISTNEDFSITLDNLLDKKINVLLKINTLSGQEGGIENYEDNKEYSIELNPGTKKIEFNLASGVESSLKLISFSSGNLSYEIPVNIFIDVQTKEGKIFDLDIAPPELNIILPTNSNLTKLIYIYNTGTGRLNDIKVTLDDSLKPYATLSEDSFGQILPQDNAHLTLNIVSGGEKTLQGRISVSTAEGVSDSIKVSITVEKDYEIPEEQQQDLSTTDTCEEIKGNVCKEGEECLGDYVFAKNQFCCIGKCVPSKKPFTKIIGWIIFLIVIVVVYWILTKYKKTKSVKINLLKIAQKKK